jgi:hypothetical protein
VGEPFKTIWRTAAQKRRIMPEGLLEGRPAYEDGPVPVISEDYYMHDADQYDVFIIRVTSCSECKQLLNLIPHVHDAGKRLIVVAESPEQFSQLLGEIFRQSDSYGTDRQKLADRLIHLFPEDMLQGVEYGIQGNNPAEEPSWAETMEQGDVNHPPTLP